MISPILAKSYGIILEKKINEWLEMEGKRDKVQVGFRRIHSTTNCLVTLRIIANNVVIISLTYFLVLWILKSF